MQQVNQSSCDYAQILPILGQLPRDLHHGKEQVWNGRLTRKTTVATGPRNHKGIKPFVRNRILQPFVHQLPQVRCQVPEVMRCLLEDDLSCTD
jgi:hypothetical protein